MSCFRSTLLVLTLALLLPAGALAADETLLSGYGGPGGSEQSVLGSELLPPARGDGGLRAPAPTRTAASPVTDAPAPETPSVGAADGSTPGGSPAGGSGSDGAPSGSPDAALDPPASGAADSSAGAGSDAGAAPGARERPAAPPVIQGARASAVPSAMSDILILLGGLALLALVALGTRAVTRPGAAAQSSPP